MTDNSIQNHSSSAPLISIIIPIYKIDEFLDSCLTSIVKQSYQNFEVILVDDGSPDKCPQICDEWVKKDSRFRVIHQENKGVSSARNAALDIVKGEFFTCVDGDDTVNTYTLEKLLTAIQKESADISFCGWEKIYPQKKITQNRPYEILPKNQLEIFLWGDYGYINGAVCKLFKTSIVKEHHIRYNETLTNSEDVVFLNNYLTFVNKSVHCGYLGYNYLIRSNGSQTNISKKSFSIARLKIWNAIHASYTKEYSPWNNFILQLAADILIDSYRHSSVEFAEKETIVKFIKKEQFKFLLFGKKRFKKKIQLSLKLFFPSLIAKIKR